MQCGFAVYRRLFSIRSLLTGDLVIMFCNYKYNMFILSIAVGFVVVVVCLFDFFIFYFLCLLFDALVVNW